MATQSCHRIGAIFELSKFLILVTEKFDSTVTKKFDSTVTQKFDSTVTQKFDSTVTKKFDSTVTKKFDSTVTQKFDSTVTKKFGPVATAFVICTKKPFSNQWKRFAFDPFTFNAAELRSLPFGISHLRILMVKMFFKVSPWWFCLLYCLFVEQL